MKWQRSVVAFVISLVISFFVFLSLNDFGITWDEPIYFFNAEKYISWFIGSDWGSKEKFFEVTSEDLHPPFRKLVGGITHEILVNRLRVIDNTRGYRISALLFVIPFTFVFAYIATSLFGYAVGILTTFMFSFLPHVFFMTPLMATDYAVCAMWFMAVVCATKAVQKPWYVVPTAIIIACLSLTKMYGMLVFIPVFGYWIIKGKTKLILPFFVLWLVLSVSLWPYLWEFPLQGLEKYIRLQRSHEGVPTMVFGKTYAHAPWWYTPLMFITTTPVLILLLGFLGAVHVIKKGTEEEKIMLGNALFPLAFFSLPFVYRYDGVRLFLTMFPFFVLLAGKGIRSLRPFAFPFVVLVWLVTLYHSVIRIHPWESAYYNELVGGMRGARTLGLETEYWGNAYLGILPWMNSNKEHMMCVVPTNKPFFYYQAMGQIESGVVFKAGRGACKYLVVLMRQGFFSADPFLDVVVKTKQPVYTFTVDSVPLVSVYDIENVK